jgi:hypothetical protein
MILPMLMHITQIYPHQAALPEMFDYFQNCTAAFNFNFSSRSDNGNDQN